GEKKNKKGLIAILIAILVLVGGGIAAKMILTKTSVTTETVKLPDDARGFSNYFKEYIVDRVEAEILFSNENENLGSEEILNKLSLLKDGFSKVSRGLASNYGKSEYKELATVMEADSNEYLSMIRETRAIVTGYSDENERKIAFIKKVEEMSEKLRSAIYITRAAFYQDVAGLSSKGVFAFNGGVMVEAGGGVMNIFLGNFEDNVVAISSDTMSEKVKEVEAGTLFGYTSSRVIKIGEALSKEIEGGWFKGVKAEVGNLEVKLTTAKVSLVMTSLNGVEEELKSLGIKGLVEDEEKPEIERLTEALGGLKGKK
ncbi:hypothetical protein IKG20_02205, partial [Candidatus Saccharibacteria bacterium]|nr:hypothetical protein [Candidatus Saccharibacteria bacterium]